eukprot:NODE_1897_length_1763_cov_50.985976_g1608_i1.p1 GENE.NODE_1897_length_1763_cov_50.985976_g1608_i1~~NODE_1897_length_1763_cov_50.985976_g1608_i1.p1  ORF type:complete len:518 (+),score=110.10 NODE_1897_length_1763_cov_50.985976_g1608_i1:82-1635(+)
MDNLSEKEQQILQQIEELSKNLKHITEGGHSINPTIQEAFNKLSEIYRPKDLRDSHSPTIQLKPKQVISARACIVCGKDDKPGQQRKSGFKCLTCIGTPNLGRFNVKVDEREGKKVKDDEGSKTINDYTILSDLGKGAYGKVKMAVHNKSGQPYAVKVIDKEKLRRITKPGSSISALDTVMQEIKIMKTMQHPNVVKLYEVIDEPNHNKLYLIMEFCEKGRIYVLNDDGTSRLGPIEKEKLKKYIVAISHGLQYLHDKGIIHRDVKPENILVDRLDHAKLADFGVSAITGESDILTHTEGSPAFMPPEEYANRPVSGAKADIWSFGVTIYAMAFGHLPFRAKDMKELADLILNTEPQYPDDAEPDLVDLLQQMLDKSDETRISIVDILQHPFVEDIRTVKGQAVETVKLSIGLEKLQPDLDFYSEEYDQYESVLVDRGEIKGNGQGINDLIRFIKEHGPVLQIVLPSPETCTLFVPRSRASTYTGRTRRVSYASYSSTSELNSFNNDKLLSSLDFMS